MLIDTVTSSSCNSFKKSFLRTENVEIANAVNTTRATIPNTQQFVSDTVGFATNSIKIEQVIFLGKISKTRINILQMKHLPMLIVLMLLLTLIQYQKFHLINKRPNKQNAWKSSRLAGGVFRHHP